MRMRGRWLVLTVVLGVGLGGCAKPNPYKRYPVTVMVTLDGQPMPDGAVQFYAVDGRGAYGGEIKNGTARFEAVAGAMRVEIGVYRLPRGMTKPPNPQLDYRENILPERYHAKTELSATITAEGPNEISFDLKSK
jgi:hypothetical protein